MEDATREIRESMLRISREIQEAEVVEARLDAGEMDEQTYVEQMRALLGRIQEATHRIGEELDGLQERGSRA
jgi:hypothetical protein